MYTQAHATYASRAVLEHSPIESLTIRVSEQYDVWPNCGLRTKPAVFDVFSDMEHFYGVLQFTMSTR